MNKIIQKLKKYRKPLIAKLKSMMEFIKAWVSKVIYTSVVVAVLALLAVSLNLLFLNFEKKSENLPEALTAIGLIIALLALDRWKHQFKYEEKYKSLQDLETAFRNRVEALRSYNSAYLKKRGEKNGDINPEDGFVLPEFDNSSKSSGDYKTAWCVASSFLSSKIEKNFSFIPDNVDRHLIELHKASSHPKDPIDDALGKYKNEVITAIRKLKD